MPKTNTLKGKKMYALAYALARKAHAGQKRKDKKTPYFEHVKEVASKVHGWDLKTIAILHDTIEDTYVTAQSLLDKGFPKPIVQAVEALTKAGGKDAEKARKKLHDYAGSIVLLTAKKA